MKSSSFQTVGIVILCIGIIAGLGSLLIDIAAGISIVLSSIVVFFVFEFFSSVLRYMELIYKELAFGHDQEALKSKNASDRDMENLFESYYNDESGITPDTNITHYNSHGDAIKKLRESGFKSTAKYKAGNYLFAIDSIRQEWVVVTPTGTGTQTHSYKEFKDFEISQGMGYMPQLHVRIVLIDKPAMNITFNSKSPDEDIAGIKSVLDKIKAGR